MIALLTGPGGSMHLSVLAAAGSSGTAAWQDMDALLDDFESDGLLSGPGTAELLYSVPFIPSN